LPSTTTGVVSDIQVLPRRQLFPNEFPNPKSDRKYYQIHLHSLDRLEQPVYSRRWRRIVFIPTTWRKFTRAVEINDLYDESPLEDRMWAQLKRMQIPAECQWHVKPAQSHYFLDFAVFCQAGKIDIETDGDTYHAEIVATTTSSWQAGGSCASMASRFEKQWRITVCRKLPTW